MSKSFKKKYSVLINDDKIGTLMISIDQDTSNSINFSYRLSAIHQDVKITSTIIDNTVMKYEKIELCNGIKNTESFIKLDEFNHNYRCDDEDGNIIFRYNLDFFEKVLFYPGKNIENSFEISKIINLKNSQIYNFIFIKISENKFKIYSPEVSYVEYDRNGILSSYYNLSTGVKILG